MQRGLRDRWRRATPQVPRSLPAKRRLRSSRSVDSRLKTARRRGTLDGGRDSQAKPWRDRVVQNRSPYTLRRWQQDGVDDVDHAVGLHDVGDRDHGHAAFGVDYLKPATLDLEGQAIAFDGLEQAFAIVGLD